MRISYVAAPDGGVQEKTPVVGLMVAPEGGEIRLQVMVWAGMSSSSAEAVNVMFWPLSVSTERSGMKAISGGVFTLRTMTVRFFVLLRAGTPSSVTVMGM